jgi:ATP-binding cassette subfamily B protein
MLEALLFRGVLELGRDLPMTDWRLFAFAALFAFLAIMLALEYPLSMAQALLGRRLENHLRIRFMEKVPRLHDRYFSSRLTSDMAHRVYELRALRDLPKLAALGLRTMFELLLSTLGLIWLYPEGAPIAVLALLVTLGLWLLSQPLLIEQDLNLRTHEGALSRFYLDAMLGLTPVRTHSAEQAVRREHEGLLVQWVQASRDFYRTFTGLRAVAGLTGVIFTGWLLLSYLQAGKDVAGILLLVYWALRLPALSQTLASTLQQYPTHRNRLMRLLEPLNAPEEITPEQITPETAAAPSAGMKIEFRQLQVRASGHTILRDISATVQAGEQIAVVGRSGAGKSSLVGVLLGWHKASAGELIIDDEPIDGSRMIALRQSIAWVDPAVQIWNRSLLDNLRYGRPDTATESLYHAISEAELLKVLEKLPEGLQTSLGEGGGLVSGGEGQRVRLGRAMLRTDARLVILDEPFRGLDRQQRSELLQRVRAYWPQATVIFISHDVGDTQQFERVWVIDDGQIVEDGSPQALCEQETQYRSLLESEQQVRQGLWAGPQWRRLWLADGQVQER